MLLLQHHLLVEDLRVGKDFREPHDPAARHTGRIERLDPVFGCFGHEPRLDRGIDRGAIADAQIVGREARIGAQLGEAERIDEPLIGLLLARRQRDLAVLRAEHAVGRDDGMVVAGAVRLLAGLAIAQKNTAELAGNRVTNGLDFAIAEECADWDECGDYVDAFGISYWEDTCCFGRTSDNSEI